jgi:hypothetical protein
MTQSPSHVDPKQLRDLGINLRGEEKLSARMPSPPK